MVKASLMRKLESIEDPKLRDVLISFLEEAERIIGETITRKEFQEFVATTNENFDRVWKAIGKLTEAQLKTEERLNQLTARVDKLAERVDQLTERVDKLTERVDQLAQRMDELAEAQLKTEKRLEKLIGEHKKTREHLGGLSNAFGYVLEDRAIRGLPEILKTRFNIELTQPLKRDYIETGTGRAIEVNLFGKGRIDGKELTILGECKAQLRKRDIDKFLNHVKSLEKYLPGDKFLVIVTYQTPPQVRKYVKEKGLKLVFSYELPL